jgi:hypothetical protein
MHSTSWEICNPRIRVYRCTQMTGYGGSHRPHIIRSEVGSIGDGRTMESTTAVNLRTVTDFKTPWCLVLDCKTPKLP